MNQIYNEDCLVGMKQIPDNSIDMILCDLPYGTTACKWDVVIPFEPLWEEWKRVAKDSAPIILTASQPFTSLLITSNLEMFKYAYTWIKTKPSGFQNAKRMPMKKHEDICVFYRKQPIYNQLNLTELSKPIKSGRIRLRNNEQHHLGVAGKLSHNTTHTGWQDSILSFANPSGAGHLHPTKKPVELFEYLIKMYSKRGDIVLDSCMGSGTTAVACINTDRNFIGFETDKNYFDIAEREINKACLF